MFRRKLKIGYFVLTGLNAYATAFYFDYLFFQMRLDFGFGNAGNFFLATLNGLVYVPAAWWAGRFAQKSGYFLALRVGFGLMALALAAGSRLPGVASQFVVMLAWTIGMCFTWPTLEGLISERETRAGLAQMLGIYNVVWAAGSALAYFTGGALLENLGRGSLFWLPVGMHVGQLGIVWWLERSAGRTKDAATLQPVPEIIAATPVESGRTAGRRAFLRMAWLANPFAYIAMNTAIPIMPDLAARLELSTTFAGFVCSVWMFTRLFTFVGLWCWPAWHYRFGWLAGSYVLMIASFAVLFLVPVLWVIVAAQIVFGIAVGLIYYSSLFYSMDVGETKAEHGGLHEAAIGAGMFAGPLVGFATLYFAPGLAHASIWTVSSLLIAGFCGMLTLKRKG